MERESYGQLELFTQAKGSQGQKARAGNPFLSYLRSYEKVIITAIVFLVSGIISFSLGVERGKKLAFLKMDSRFELAGKTSKPAVPAAPAQRSAPAAAPAGENIAAPEKPRDNLQNFTIQVVSCSSKANAQQEAERLKKKGFSPLVLTKGRFAIVCVGKFPSKATAETLLVELKRRYRDCFIRRL